MSIEPSALQYFEAVASLDEETAYFAVDKNQEITAWSRGAERLLGFSPEEVIGEHCSKAIRCLRCSTTCGLKQYGHVQGKVMDHYRKDGTEITVTKKARAIRDPDGNFLGGVELLRPVKKKIFPPPPHKPINFHGILTANPNFISFLTQLRHFAHTEANILIRGETGTGKELIARAIHAMSPRARGPFIALNCGTLSREFLASEIFGHKKGSFTGATSDKDGLLKAAEGGTLFLDEVAELPKDVQVMLLRVLQERRYRPLGETKDYPADVRFLSATHASLRQAVKEDKFREDLLYRLRVLPLFIPPLRERKEDIGVLWQEMLSRSAHKNKVRPAHTTPELMHNLTQYPWPGNVRELENLAENLTVVRSGKEILPEHLPPEFFESDNEDIQVKKARSKSPDLDAVKEALEQANGSPEEAANLLGVSRVTFWRWRKKLGL